MSPESDSLDSSSESSYKTIGRDEKKMPMLDFILNSLFEAAHELPPFDQQVPTRIIIPRGAPISQYSIVVGIDLGPMYVPVNND